MTLSTWPVNAVYADGHYSRYRRALFVNNLFVFHDFTAVEQNLKQ